MKGLVAYLILGCLFGLAIELAWPFFVEDEPIQMKHRILAILLWPIILLVAIFNVITSDNDDDEGPRTSGAH